ncbi:MAG: hypothetical protein ACFFAQ_04665 [Promethearchaeota archaeon]
MKKTENMLFQKDLELIDTVQIKCKNAIYSTYDDDPIFNVRNFEIINPIFCCGIISSINSKVYNYKIDDSVLFISFNQDLIIKLSSNLILKFSENNNYKLISIIPYASYAMKILRVVDPKIGQNIVLIGLNFFSILLKELFRLSGTNVFIIDVEEYSNKYHKVEENDLIINGLDSALKKMIKFQIDSLIMISEFDEKIQNLLLNLNIKRKYELSQISIYDKGFEDLNYIKGIRYPHDYVRWDFKQNLKYFIFLIENNLINLDFFDIRLIEVSSLDEMKNFIKKITESNLYLFNIEK